MLPAAFLVYQAVFTGSPATRFAGENCPFILEVSNILANLRDRVFRDLRASRRTPCMFRM